MQLALNVMRADHVFSRVCEDANGKETEVTNKEGCCKVNRCNQTQGPLKQTADATGVSGTSIKRLRKEKVDTGGAPFSILSIPLL